MAAAEQHTGQADTGRPLDVHERVEPGVLGEALVGVDDKALDSLGREAPAVAEGKTGNAGRETLIRQDRGGDAVMGTPFGAWVPTCVETRAPGITPSWYQLGVM